MSQPQQQLPSALAMPFLEHLRELRGRLIKALCGVVMMTIGSYAYIEQIFSFLCEPLQASFLESPSKLMLIGTAPAEAFLVKLKIAVGAGIVFSAPYSFLQLWKFISPGLHAHERKFAIPFVLCTTLFFFLGISFCFFVVLPVALTFFVGEFASIGVAPNIKIDEYLSFTLRFLFAFGAVFEMPVLSYFLARLRLISHHSLIRYFRYAVVIIFIVAGVLTPAPDVMSQLLMALPLLILYGVSVGVAYMVGRGRE